MACDMDTIITISRQFGSGGREVGSILAEQLSIPFYDRELISIAAKESGLDEKAFENADEHATNSLLYSLSLGVISAGGRMEPSAGMPLGDQVYLAQAAAIREFAAKGPCVIVGRCADYVLSDKKNCLRFFIHAPLEERVRRAIERYDVPRERAASVVQKTDKRRATYHDYYAATKWGMAESYHAALNSSVLGLRGTAELLCELVRRACQH